MSEGRADTKPRVMIHEEIAARTVNNVLRSRVLSHDPTPRVLRDTSSVPSASPSLPSMASPSEPPPSHTLPPRHPGLPPRPPAAASASDSNPKSSSSSKRRPDVQSTELYTLDKQGDVKEKVKINVRIQRTKDFKGVESKWHMPSFEVDVLDSFSASDGTGTSGGRTPEEMAASVLVDVIGLSTLRRRLREAHARVGYSIPRYEVQMDRLSVTPKKARGGKRTAAGAAAAGGGGGGGGEGQGGAPGKGAVWTPNPMLKNISTTIRPGRFTLVMGPPGSGKSTCCVCALGVIMNGCPFYFE